MILDNFGILTLYRDVTEEEQEAFDGINDLTETRSKPFGKTVRNEVREAALVTLATICGQTDAVDSIEICSFLKFVSIDFHTVYK